MYRKIGDCKGFFILVEDVLRDNIFILYSDFNKEISKTYASVCMLNSSKN